MMSKYLVKLTPLDTFFFSQENKYRKKENGFEAEYYQESAYFPQQTALLGMLRYHLLQINGQIPINDENKSEELIGKCSFDIRNNNDFNDFGKIKSLSPVFILDNSNYRKYIPQPKDLLMKDDCICPLTRIKPEKAVKTNFNGNVDLQFFDKYNEKDGLSDFLVNFDNICDFRRYDYFDGDENNVHSGIFRKIEKIGITKKTKKDKNEDGFYKQIVLKMRKNFSFSFYAEIDNENNLNKIDTVPLGPEKNMFKIEFEEAKDIGDFSSLIEFNKTNSPKIVLLSDTYLKVGEYEGFDFALTKTKPFRFIQSKVKKNHNYSSNIIEGKDDDFKRSDRYNLIERCSVFYFSDDEKLRAFEKKLQKTNFTKIGYNYYKII